MCLSKIIKSNEYNNELIDEECVNIFTKGLKDGTININSIIQTITPVNLFILPDWPAHEWNYQMKKKLKKAREKGLGNWWDTNTCSLDFLEKLLCDHLLKTNEGNNIDIANISMFIYFRRKSE